METTPNTHITPLLTGNEIARILHISRAYAYQLMQKKQLPIVKIGRSVRVRPEDLEKFITSNLSSGLDTQ